MKHYTSYDIPQPTCPHYTPLQVLRQIKTKLKKSCNYYIARLLIMRYKKLDLPAFVFVVQAKNQ